MTLVPTLSLVNAARASGHGVAAFNVITLEHAEAVVTASRLAGLPVIVQVSQNALVFHRDDPRPLARAISELADSAETPVALHLDHSTSLDLCRRAADAGFSSVMFDASQFDHDENVAQTRAAADWARANGIGIEAELGAIGGKGGAHTVGVRTVPSEAREFVHATGVDALAVAVGSTHAMEQRTASLDHALICELREAVPVPLVLHGSSGLPDEELIAAIASGMVKINVGTALNSAFTTALDLSLATRGTSSDPRPHLSAARAAVETVVGDLLRVISDSRASVSEARALRPETESLTGVANKHAGG